MVASVGSKFTRHLEKHKDARVYTSEDLWKLEQMARHPPLITAWLICSHAGRHASSVHSWRCYRWLSQRVSHVWQQTKLGGQWPWLLSGAGEKAPCRSVTKVLTAWAAYKEELSEQRHLLQERQAARCCDHDDGCRARGRRASAVPLIQGFNV